MKLFTVLVKFSNEDENGKIKKRNEHYICNARSAENVIEIISHELRNVNEDWEIHRIAVSNVVSVLNYNGDFKVTRKEETVDAYDMV